MTLSDFFSIDSFRDVVDIPDALDDPELKTLGKLASSDVDTAIYPYVGDDSTGAVTTLTGDDLEIAQNATSFLTASLWKAKKQNKDLAKYYLDLYKSQIDKLVIKLKSRRTSRTKRASVSTEYQTEQMFTQMKKF